MRRSLLPLVAFVALVSALVLGTGCGTIGTPEFRACTSDAQCGGGEVCFPDGCGDPGVGIRVEVMPNPQLGYHAQDFEVPDRELKATQHLEVLPPSAITGLVQRSFGGTSPGLDVFPYDGPVTFNVSGESKLIPGLRRRFTAAVVIKPGVEGQPDGTYTVPVSSGVFTVAVATANTAIPAASELNQVVETGQSAVVNFVLEASSDIFGVAGRLVRTGNLAIQNAEMEVQAFDPRTLLPLSQPVPASSGQIGSTGDFSLFLAPKSSDGANYDSFLIVATPKDASALVPTKKFSVAVENTLRDPLELGDYGVPVDVTGSVTDAQGLPILGATVYVEGEVNGDGTFKSQRAVTLADGTFSLKTLASKTGTSMTLWVIPSAKSPHGILRKLVSITSSTRELAAASCPPKPRLTGSVIGADGVPAAGIRVVAEALKETSGILPPSGAEAMTNAEGAFELALDPALYRLDFIPTVANVPRASRMMEIVATRENTLDGMPLSRARTVSGTVSARPDKANLDLVKAVPYAGVRFFRVITLPDNEQGSVLLAESVADAQGNYTVTLPTGAASEAEQ